MSNNFKQVLEVRTENLKSQRSRAEQFSSGGVTTSLPQSATQVLYWMRFIRIVMVICRGSMLGLFLPWMMMSSRAGMLLLTWEELWVVS